MCIKSQLTVFFDEPFWVGVFERINNEKLEVARVVFGVEPKDYEVFDFIQKEFYNLNFSLPVEVEKPFQRKTNPKRVQREINAQLSQKGIGTKAQQALKLQQEEKKMERCRISKQISLTKKKREFELKQLKKKEKHKGR